MLRYSAVIVAAVIMGGDVVFPFSREALTERPMSSPDVRGLMDAARGASPMICSLAADGVWNMGWRGGSNDAPRTPLGEVMREDAMPSRREKLSPGDVQLLLGGLASSDACVRELAVRLLGQHESADVVAGLTERLGAPDSLLREVAALGLGFVAPRSAVDALLRVVRDASAGVRANAAWALGRIDDGRAVSALMDALRDQQSVVRQASAGALGQLDSIRAAPALLRVLRQDDNAHVRRTAAWALAQLDARDSANEMVQALTSERDPAVREMLVWALGSIGARSSATAVAAVVERDTSDVVRETGVWALAEIGDKSVAGMLGDMLSKERSAKVRGTTVWALGELDVSPAPASLIAALRDADDDVRYKTAWALMQIGDKGAIPALRTALTAEKNDRIKKGLLRALVSAGDRSEALTELLSSSDPKVREAAIRGIVGGNAMGPWPWPWPRPRPFPNNSWE